MSEVIHASWDVWAVQFLCALPLAVSLIGCLWQGCALSRLLAWRTAAQLLLLVAIPWIYRQAHCGHDLAQLQSLLEQSRIGEAQKIADCILRLNPAAALGGIPVKRIAADLDREVNLLETRSAFPLPVDADLPTRVDRARDLAMLGKTAAALALFPKAARLSDSEVSDSPAACALLGTIHESRQEWRLAEEWYGQALAAWQSRPDSAERTAGLVQAATGIGFTQRKLGRYREAEGAYRQVLELSPSAQSHFLLAQFYEDTQQAAPAQVHARAAARLDPDRYLEPSRQLTDKLITLQFGCWGAYRASRQ